jgi:hypothetical protein
MRSKVDEMTWKIPVLRPCLVVLALLANAGPARADAIDGHWCFADGRRLSISGPDLVTPGGKRMTGDYDRHAFAYVVPGGEPGAGATVFMVQLDEETIWVKTGARPSAAGDSETWRRCSERIS